jgi:hypothetical protein
MHDISPLVHLDSTTTIFRGYNHITESIMHTTGMNKFFMTGCLSTIKTERTWHTYGSVSELYSFKQNHAQ